MGISLQQISRNIYVLKTDTGEADLGRFSEPFNPRLTVVIRHTFVGQLYFSCSIVLERSPFGKCVAWRAKVENTHGKMLSWTFGLLSAYALQRAFPSLKEWWLVGASLMRTASCFQTIFILNLLIYHHFKWF